MKKILVIDDLKENTTILHNRLTKEGYDVVIAFDGKTGMDMAKSEIPDLILCDVMMPGIDGYQVCRDLHAAPETALIPIILVTAKTEAEDIKEGLEAGAFDYIKKPFNKVELLARVTSALKFSEIQKKLVEAEKRDVFTATVVTTNHKIKQPLTLISLACSALKRELAKEEFSKEVFAAKIQYVEQGIQDITAILNQLHSIKSLQISEYIKNIQMIDA